MSSNQKSLQRNSQALTNNEQVSGINFGFFGGNQQTSNISNKQSTFQASNTLKSRTYSRSPKNIYSNNNSNNMRNPGESVTSGINFGAFTNSN